MKKSIIYIIMVLLLVPGIMSACSSAPITVLVTDQLGRLVGLTKAPERIVSLDPGVTEILYALGLGDNVVGVSNDSDFPMEVRNKTFVGDAIVVDWAQIKKLSPDLVVLVTYSSDYLIPDFEKQRLNTFALAPTNLDEVLEAITLVGEITERQEAAAEAVIGLQERIQAVAEKTDAATARRRR